MPREKGRKGQNNKSTKQTQRVSSRHNKGVHSSRGRPRVSIISPSDHSSSDSESEIEPDTQTTQLQTAAEQVLQPHASAHTSGQVQEDLDARISRLIQEGIAKAISDHMPAKRPMTSEEVTQLPATKRQRTTGNHTTSPLLTLSDEGSDVEDAAPDLVVRQSFGLMAGEHVSQTLRLKILTGKDIDMYDLLEDSVTKEKPMYMVQQQSGKKPKWVADSSPKYITLDQWNEAFASFIAIYQTTAKTLQENQNLVLAMLTYQRQINSLASVNRPWWKYDIQFRKQMNANPGRFTFADLRHDLLLNLEMRQRSTSYNKQPHQTQHQSQQPFRTSSHRTNNSFRRNYQPNLPAIAANPGTGGVPKGYCFKYHTAGHRCPDVSRCTFKHECPKCAATHSLQFCKK